MVSPMSSKDPKAEHHRNKNASGKDDPKPSERLNWFRGALWVPVPNREEQE